MKNSYPFLLLVCFAVHSSFAQVKKQYQQDNSQTMVVVKENLSSDEDILNSLDPDDYGMHQVIRITTETEKTITPKVAPPTRNTESATVIQQPFTTLSDKSPVITTSQKTNVLSDRPVKMKRWSVREKTSDILASKKTAKESSSQTNTSKTSKPTTPILTKKSSTPTSVSTGKGSVSNRSSGSYGKISKRKNPKFKKAKRKKVNRKGFLKCFKF